MSMSGEGEADAFWHLRKDIGIVHQDEHRFTVYNLGQGWRELVSSRPKVCEPAQPEAPSVVRQQYALVLENLDAVRHHRVPDSVSVVPPVMITQHSNHSEWCLQSGEFISNGLRINKMSSDHTPNDEVAKYNYEVRLFGIGRSDDFFQLAKILMWCTYVQIGYDRDLETSMLGMPRVNGNCAMNHCPSWRLPPESTEPQKQEAGDANPQYSFCSW